MRATKALPLALFPILASPTSACLPTPPFLAHRDAYQCAAYSTTAPDPTFTYRLAASFSGKGTRYRPQNDVYHFSPASPAARRTSPSKKHRPNSGQDAFFIASIGPAPQSHTLAFAVADGVGGWTDAGIDPADFSHGLCRHMQEHAQNMSSGRASALRPLDLLQHGYDAVSADPDVEGGGTTACVAVARPDGRLEVANLGDSGFVQLRAGRIHYASEPQTHAFNTPYQLSLVPPAMLAQSRAFGGDMLHDMPSDAAVSHHEVRHGDVFVFGSDGVWDNLSPADVLRTVGRVMVGFGGWSSGTEERGQGLGAEASKGLERLTVEEEEEEGGGIGTKERTLQGLLAVSIAGEAKLTSEDSKMDGPFAREVQKYYPQDDWHGGKVDDICVVVAIAVQQ